ncbi:MAG TPA: ABC transporter ATP-binding protein, partial [Acidimicrobiales bacterium]|nr:ABC transporter ATP-binding protein [Acidimicrobiales bacterium]
LTVANTLILAAVVSILFYENPPLAALALCTLPLLPLAAKRFSTKAFPVSMGLQKELGALAEVVEETVAGIRVVKGFGTEDQQKSKLGAASKSVYELAVQTGKVRAFFAPILTLLPLLGLVAVLWYGGHQVLDHRLTIGQLAAYLLYVNLLVAPLQLPAWVVGQAQRAVASGQRVAELLTTSPEVADPIHPVRLNPLGKGEISFKDVVFSYGDADSQPVLDGFNLKIPGGSAVALVGSTGCGKSTVARLISRFYDVNSGSIQVDGLDVRNCSLKELRKMVGIVFEETFLFTDTIRANIAFADPRSPMDRVARAAQLAGADRFIESLTDGYDTLIGERGFSLSGGQRQRIALARAILSDPRILILDDATSAVDPTKEHEILGAMAEVMKDRTTILIAHRPATVALSDWVVFMDQGKVAAQGTHDELLASDRRYSEIMSGQLAT